jgi:hypothetical protein
MSPALQAPLARAAITVITSMRRQRWKRNWSSFMS